MHPRLIEKAIDAAGRNGAEMVMWDYCEFVDESEIPSRAAESSGLSLLSPDNKLVLLQKMAFTWVRLIKTSTMRRLGVSYPEGRTKQDIPAHWREILNIGKRSLRAERLSYYRLRPGATSRRMGKSLLDWLAVLDIVEDNLRQTAFWDEFSDELYRQQFNALATVYAFIDKKYKPTVHQLIKEKLTGEAGIRLAAGQICLSWWQHNFFKAMNGNLFSYTLCRFVGMAAVIKHSLLRR